MRTRLALVTGALVLLLVIGATPAGAIVWGVPDGEAHPQVGLVVFDVDGTPSHRCSGTLLSPTVLLTAGHCTDGADAARVWFDAEITDPSWPFGGGSAVEGTPHTHPGFSFDAFPNTSDVGVVVLDEPVHGVVYASLPEVGALDALQTSPRSGPAFTIVGYGLQSAFQVRPQADLERYQGTPQLVTLKSSLTDGWNIHLSGNRGRKSPGAACFGDSGGPAFAGDGLVVAGVGSFVLNLNCVGAGFYYRVDTAHAQDFVTGFLGG